MKFHKYQALGNDYLVAEASFDDALPTDQIKRICNRHVGDGSDGILLGKRMPGGFALRIFNHDGSEAEKSGNGLRIYARYLWDSKALRDERFSVTTKGGVVHCQVRDAGKNVFVEMGRASFDSEVNPVRGNKRE